jgi:hypothetical protein
MPLPAHPEIVRTLVIPAAVKWEICDKLDQAGIAERTLYPGWEGVARQLSPCYPPA